MNLGKIVENEDQRLMRQAALVTAFLGALTVLSGLMLMTGGARVAAAAIGVLQLALAFGVSRGSRACAVAIFALFVVDRLATMMVAGVGALLSVWNVVLCVVLFAGVRATFAAAQRRAAQGRRAAVA